MARKHGRVGHSRASLSSSGGPEEFAADLKRRRQAAQGLEQDLLTSVPLLYGSPGSPQPHGDAGIALARIHREELVRRNGGGVSQLSGKPSEVRLPFERGMAVLAFLLWLFFSLAE